MSDHEEHDAAVLVDTIIAKQDQLRMRLVLLHAVVDRTGNTREGYYLMRQYDDLMSSVVRDGCIHDYITGLDNVIATLDRGISALEAGT